MYKTSLMCELRNEYPGKDPMKADGYILDIDLFLPLPATMSKKKKSDILQNRDAYNHRKDVDNMAKWVMDCMNGIIYTDDHKVFCLKVHKRYDEEPRTVIMVRALTRRSGDDEKDRGN